MKTTIKVKGKILFDPPDKTKKHKSQASWKRVAYLELTGGILGYYRWFILKRFNLHLASPLRGPHITFINDSLREIGGENEWTKLKKRWQGKYVEVELNLDPRTDDINWWLTVDEVSRKPLHDIRGEVGLGRPYWGLHMTVGKAGVSYDEVEKGTERIARDNVAHSKYIHELAKKGLI